MAGTFGWLKQVTAVLKVAERLIPVVEVLVPGAGLIAGKVLTGVQKAEVVTESVNATAQSLLPGVNMSDPRVQAALQRKINADVALANLLQQLAEAAHPLQIVDPLESVLAPPNPPPNSH